MAPVGRCVHHDARHLEPVLPSTGRDSSCVTVSTARRGRMTVNTAHQACCAASPRVARCEAHRPSFASTDGSMGGPPLSVPDARQPGCSFRAQERRWRASACADGGLGGLGHESQPSILDLPNQHSPPSYARAGSRTGVAVGAVALPNRRWIVACRGRRLHHGHDAAYHGRSTGHCPGLVANMHPPGAASSRNCFRRLTASTPRSLPTQQVTGLAQLLACLRSTPQGPIDTEEWAVHAFPSHMRSSATLDGRPPSCGLPCRS